MAAATTETRLDVQLYVPFDFHRQGEVSLQTTQPHLNAGFEQVMQNLAKVLPYFTALAAQMETGYAPLAGRTAEELKVKQDEYAALRKIFSENSGIITNAELCLSDLHTIRGIFKRPPISETDLETIKRYSQKTAGDIRQLETESKAHVVKLEETAVALANQLCIVRQAQTIADYHLGWFGKAANGGGSVGVLDSLKQYVKPRKHENKG